MAVKRPKTIRLENFRIRVIRGPHKDDSTRWYWYCETDVDRKAVVHFRGWLTSSEAAEKCAQINQNKPSARITDVKTVKDLLSNWLGSQIERKDISPKSIDIYKTSAVHLVRLLGHIRLEKLSIDDLEIYRDTRLGEGAATYSVLYQIRRLIQAWLWGQKRGQAPLRALPAIKINQKPSKPHRTPTRGEVAVVLEQLDRNSWSWLALYLYFSTGCRLGEISGLRWRDIDMMNGYLSVDGKTGARAIPIGPSVIAELSRWHEQSENTDPEARIWRHKISTFEHDVRKKHLYPACEKAGIERFSPQGFRRLAVDTLQRSRVDIATAASIMGHRPEVMLKYYRRATEDDRRQAIQDAGFGDLPSGKVLPFSKTGS
jgi:integrase